MLGHFFVVSPSSLESAIKRFDCSFIEGPLASLLLMFIHRCKRVNRIRRCLDEVYMVLRWNVGIDYKKGFSPDSLLLFVQIFQVCRKTR
jgi:hypothetical protein